MDNCNDFVLEATYLRAYCGKSEEVIVPQGVELICKGAFAGCKTLKRVVLPEGVLSIGIEAFLDCSSLEEIVLPESLGVISSRAFWNCTSLKGVVIPRCVGYIGTQPFLNCTSLSSIRVEEGNKIYCSEGNCLINARRKWIVEGCRSSEILEGTSVLKIGFGAFEGRTGVKQIHIPNGVMEIGERAFFGCSGLEKVTLAESVRKIGALAFAGTALFKQETNWKDGLLYLGNCLIAAKKELAGEVCVEDGTTVIASSAFSGCKALERITIPGSVEALGDEVFMYCTSLKYAELRCTFREISDFGEWVFSGCASLEEVCLPEGISKLPEGSFDGCSSLKYIKLPEGLTSIEPYAFRDCSSLESVELPEGLTSIEPYAFGGCVSLRKIVLPESLMRASSDSFADCKNLTIFCPRSISERLFQHDDDWNGEQRIVFFEKDADKNRD